MSLFKLGIRPAGKSLFQHVCGDHAELCPAYVLDSLERDCDQSHEHAPWGASQTHGRLQFHTALEAEYPQPLCAHVADCVRKRD